VIGPAVEDRFAIADLCARYAWTLDTGDTEGFVACFTEDAVFDEIVVARGREQIRRAVRQVFHDNALFPGRQHLIGQTLFEPDPHERDDHWRMRSFAHVVALRDTGANLFWTGWYDDIVAKVDGQWLFAYRHPAKWEGDVLAGFPAPAISHLRMPPNWATPLDEGEADDER
jgi:hypothetical protein